ncbi:hypothetical protein [Variovorax sp. E3]|uniref:hypothetical protein n=1 Tax=Variovorax sp. E3 TaxID=1914993 RepID=UPI0018DE6E53|nr:hypothetical protein [Variovorax sp. E3]
MTTTGNTTGFDRDDGEDLRDPALRRALDHAPDSNATPDARTRDAILKMAHNLAAVPAATRPAANSASAAPWWRRVFGGGGEPRSRMPWNAAFATVLVATFVTVLWHREPVPDAQLDGEARVAGLPRQRRRPWLLHLHPHLRPCRLRPRRMPHRQPTCLPPHRQQQHQQHRSRRHQRRPPLHEERKSRIKRSSSR